MAPVGRWQQGRDLNWYAKTQDDDATAAKQKRDDEIRRIKEAEQDAMAVALGLPVAPRRPALGNANMTPLGGNEVSKVVQEATDADDNVMDGDGGGHGIGFGSYGGLVGMNDTDGEVLAPVGMESGGSRTLIPRSSSKDRESKGARPSRNERSREHGRREDRDRHREREHRDRDGRHRHHRNADKEHRHFHHHRHHGENRDERTRGRRTSRSHSFSVSPRPDRRDRRPESDRHRSRSPRKSHGSRRDRNDSRRQHHR